jgi:hypothetical protein
MRETARKYGYQRNPLGIPLDAVQKTYYCGSKFKRQRCFTTTALLGLAPVRSARASAANHRECTSARRQDDLGVATVK